MRPEEAQRQYKEASDFEETSPREALKAYKRIEASNRPYSLSILALAVICPAIAFFIIYGITELTGGHKAWVAILLLIVVGFIPPLLLYKIRLDTLEAQHGGMSLNYLHALLVALLNAVLAFLMKFVPLFIVLIHAVIMAAPIIILINVLLHFLTGMPFFWQSLDGIFYIAVVILGIFAVIVYLTAVTEEFMRIPNGGPLPGGLFIWPAFLKHIPLALKHMRWEVFSDLTIFPIGYALYGAGFGIPYGLVGAGLIEDIFVGIMLGLEFSHKLEKDFIFGNILRIAKVRCLVRLGRRNEALHVLRNTTEDTPDFSHKPVVKYLGDALGFFIRGFDINEVTGPSLDPGYTLDSHPKLSNEEPVDAYIYDNIHSAAKALETTPPKYIDIYVDSIDKTRRLVDLGDDKSIERLIHISNT